MIKIEISSGKELSFYMWRRPSESFKPGYINRKQETVSNITRGSGPSTQKNFSVKIGLIFLISAVSEDLALAEFSKAPDTHLISTPTLSVYAGYLT